MHENEIARVVVNCTFLIHKKLGPGLLESIYEEVLCHELLKNNPAIKRQQVLPVIYDNIRLDLGFRSDIIIENKVIVEIKSIELLAPVHFKQVLTYLRLSNLKLGLLINFNEALIKDGIHRIVNDL